MTIQSPSSLGSGVFVTGTDTEIGKTFVSCALLRAWHAQGWRTVGMKPVAAGAEWVDGQWRNDDVDRLDVASSEHPPLSLRCPYLFQTAAAPHVAAQMQGVAIDGAVILDRLAQLKTQASKLVVEGVGGFCVPLSDTYDTAQMAVDLALPVVMVVGLRLGCINQALLTYEAISARGLTLVGWVANSTQDAMPFEQANIEAIAKRISAPCWGHIPRLAPHEHAKAHHYLNMPAA